MIKHNTSAQYCPQSNGKAERLNRALIEKARCMMITLGINNNLWVAAINTTNYLRNISPSSCLNGMSPHEALYKKLAKVKHLRIFGSKAYPLILSKRNDKFDQVAKDNCIFIGYPEKEGIYWLLDKNTHKTFRSRDVKINEWISNNEESEISIVSQFDPIEMAEVKIKEEDSEEELNKSQEDEEDKEND